MRGTVASAHSSSLAFKGKGTETGHLEQGCETGDSKTLQSLNNSAFFDQSMLIIFHLDIKEPFQEAEMAFKGY